MAALPAIRRFKLLQKVGIFQNYRHDPTVPDFSRYNLVYGFNGTGKTTLSRIFRCLDDGNWRSTLRPGARFELELTDGRVITPDSEAAALEHRVLVFNLDFINENLRWSEGRASPVFYLGKGASARAELLERIERRIPVRDEQLQQAQATYRAKERALSTFYTTTARLIAETLGLGRQYDARHLKRDYEDKATSDPKVLSDDEREAFQALIRQPTAYEKLYLPELSARESKLALQRAQNISDTTIVDLSLCEMEQHPSMVPWIKTGFDYHKKHRLRSCLFCGNDLTDIRFGVLQGALDDRFDQFAKEIQAAAATLEKCKTSLSSLLLALPSERALSPTLSRGYREVTDGLKISISHIESMLNQALSAVVSKQAFLNSANWPSELRDARKMNNEVEALRQRTEQLRALIDRHNDEQDKFAHRQMRAREELKLALLSEYSDEHEALSRDMELAEQILQSRRRLHEKLVDRAAALRAELRDHGPAVGRINSLLHAYLGHDEIRLEVYEEGYRILRHGKIMDGPLSEGERTAIALCYFLSKLEEEGRSLDQQIVVVDDPVSSLDAGALNYCFNLLKGTLQNAQQLIVFTHNLAFMNEIKKWLRGARDEGKASFFYLRTWHDGDRERRHATIVEMPKLLRGYGSEYQYLFYLVRKCAEEGPESPNIPGYIMPNVIRRVLELFLAFKIPSSEGLGEKISRPLVQNAAIEQARLQALIRLTQVESHSDSLDDFIGFSSMTIEETHQAAQSVLRLIEVLDENHYTRMCEIAN